MNIAFRSWKREARRRSNQYPEALFSATSLLILHHQEANLILTLKENPPPGMDASV